MDADRKSKLDELAVSSVEPLETAKELKRARLGALSEQETKQEGKGDELEMKSAEPEGQAPLKWEEEMTLAIPKELPMQYGYKAPEFYVRECYDEYYTEIIRLLYKQHMDVITVTGTPGIGKSMFYVYFFLRYSTEYPETTVVTASFKNQEMKKVAVWKNGGVTKMASNSIATKAEMEQIVTNENKDANAKVIHLYDGIPNEAPTDIKMVCFTSPDIMWLNSPENRKDSYYAKLFMPLWDLDELHVAATTLDLKMNDTGDEVDDLVEERFHTFGGVARACLATNPEIVANEEEEIDSVIQKLNDVDQVKKILGDEEGELIHHSICHYQPKPGNMRRYTIAPPSLYVKRSLVGRLGKIVYKR